MDVAEHHGFRVGPSGCFAPKESMSSPGKQGWSSGECRNIGSRDFVPKEQCLGAPFGGTQCEMACPSLTIVLLASQMPVRQLKMHNPKKSGSC